MFLILSLDSLAFRLTSFQCLLPLHHCIIVGLLTCAVGRAIRLEQRQRLATAVLKRPVFPVVKLGLRVDSHGLVNRGAKIGGRARPRNPMESGSTTTLRCNSHLKVSGMQIQAAWPTGGGTVRPAGSIFLLGRFLLWGLRAGHG